MKFEIESDQLDEVRRILGRIVPGVPVWALRESFSDSDLPFRVDVIDLASVSREFKAAVEGRHLELQPNFS